MTYDPSTPADALEDPSVTEPKFRENFTKLESYTAINHVTINTAATPSPDQGKHKFLHMPEQSVPPSPVTTANEVALYSRQSSLTSVAELVFIRESDGSKIEFTGLLGSPTGWTRLPSGILLKWGTNTVSGAVTTMFPVIANTPAFTQVFSAHVTAENATGVPDVSATLMAFTPLDIKVYGSSRTTTGLANVKYWYLVIGI